MKVFKENNSNKAFFNNPKFKAVLGVLGLFLLILIFPCYAVALFCIAYVLFGVVMVGLGIAGIFIIPYQIFLKMFEDKD